ncbi:DMT family transporter [Variovorax sp. dw_308]|uniref:DMT family transporter n=1 Tax=Variovorax sp. dw_308 TaxID=2721546 RepID=UPI001C4422E7|nr:EamA family transporter [Variovorax sp. dw_308]
MPKSYLHALGAIALWATLASLGTALSHVPPFLLTGLSLAIGGLLSLPSVLRDRAVWRIPPRTLALGVYGLFGFHFLLFLALRHAPPVEANLVNYLWPLLMVVLAPVLLAGVSLRPAHLVAALLGFTGAAIAILGARDGTAGATTETWGFALAAGSAFIWSSYSLWTRRVPAFSTAAIGLFGLVSGMLSLACHAVLEPSASLSMRDWLLLAVCGLGPLGAAFYLWDMALKGGDVRQIGILSYLTPLASTALLLVVTGRPLSWTIALAAALIISAAVLGARTKSA